MYRFWRRRRRRHEQVCGGALLFRPLLSLRTPPPPTRLPFLPRPTHTRLCCNVQCAPCTADASAVSALSPLPPPPALLLGPLPPSPPSLLCICSDRCHRRLRATLPKLNVALIAPSLTRSSPNSRSLARSGARGVEGERGGTTERNVQSVGRRLGPAHSRTTDGQRRSGVSSGRQAEDGRTRRDGHCPPLHCLAPLPSETD